MDFFVLIPCITENAKKKKDPLYLQSCLKTYSMQDKSVHQ